MKFGWLLGAAIALAGCTNSPAQTSADFGAKQSSTVAADTQQPTQFTKAETEEQVRQLINENFPGSNFLEQTFEKQTLSWIKQQNLNIEYPDLPPETVVWLVRMKGDLKYIWQNGPIGEDGSANTPAFKSGNVIVSIQTGGLISVNLYP